MNYDELTNYFKSQNLSQEEAAKMLNNILRDNKPIKNQEKNKKPKITSNNKYSEAITDVYKMYMKKWLAVCTKNHNKEAYNKFQEAFSETELFDISLYDYRNNPTEQYVKQNTSQIELTDGYYTFSVDLKELKNFSLPYKELFIKCSSDCFMHIGEQGEANNPDLVEGSLYFPNPEDKIDEFPFKIHTFNDEFVLFIHSDYINLLYKTAMEEIGNETESYEELMFNQLYLKYQENYEKAEKNYKEALDKVEKEIDELREKYSDQEIIDGKADKEIDEINKKAEPFEEEYRKADEKFDEIYKEYKQKQKEKKEKEIEVSKMGAGAFFTNIIKVCTVLNKLSDRAIAKETPSKPTTEYYSRKHDTTIKRYNRPIYYVIGEKGEDTTRNYARIKPRGHIEYTHSFHVRSHWRTINPKKYGKNRKGEYVILGKTWVTDYFKGNGDFEQKIRIIK